MFTIGLVPSLDRTMTTKQLIYCTLTCIILDAVIVLGACYL